MSSAHIVLGVSGSIAAYKSAILVRLLKKEGYRVRVLLTDSARAFISPLTLSALSEEAVLSSFYDTNTGEWHNHVALANWADLMVIAPVSAHTLSKLAYGQCDNVLLATYLSIRQPILVAPAMDRDMYQHPSTQTHLATLRGLGHRIIEGKEGELASGLWGRGRMAEPEEIVSAVKDMIKRKDRFKDQKVLLTSGPTYEYIDPVRYVSSPSTGRMGTALAEAFAQQGAYVQLVSALQPSQYAFSSTAERIKYHKCVSANDMYAHAKRIHPKCNIAIFAASVSDYKPAKPQEHKLKSHAQTYTLSMNKNPDIAFELGKQKKEKQIHVGFSLETQGGEKSAFEKLKKKNLDLIVLNSLQDKGAGFGLHTNSVTVLFRDGEKKRYGLKDKRAVADDVLEALYARYG